MNALLIGFLAVGTIVGAVMGYYGAFGTTGTRWYEACWAKSVEYKKLWRSGHSSKDLIAPDPYTALLWEDCEIEARRGVYLAGMVFHTGYFMPDKGKSPQAYALAKACPSDKIEIPAAGLYLLAVDLIQQDGGPSFLYRFLPAKIMISEVMKKRWPQCSKERERQGYPKVVEKSPGVFDYEEPCAPCERTEANQKQVN